MCDAGLEDMLLVKLRGWLVQYSLDPKIPDELLDQSLWDERCTTITTSLSQFPRSGGPGCREQLYLKPPEGTVLVADIFRQDRSLRGQTCMASSHRPAVAQAEMSDEKCTVLGRTAGW